MSTKITSNDPTITAERSFKDLDLNFTSHPIKKDVSRHYNEKAIINAVKNLVSTNFYEKPFQPDFGAGIRGLLFEPVDSVFGASIERKLSETIKNYEPRVAIESITAIPAPDQNGYSVRMVFYIINSPNPVTINFFLERIR
jgi:phage baseplate assembly protein W